MKRILAATLAVTLLTGSVLANAHDRDRDHDRGRHSRNDERGRHRDHDRHAYSHSHRAADRYHRDDHRDRYRAHAQRHARFHAGHYYRPAGYQAYAWRHGTRLPAAYCASRYVVHDYRAYDLYRPPHAHHWIRVDHDVVLAAVATGAVVAVVNNLFY